MATTPSNSTSSTKASGGAAPPSAERLREDASLTAASEENTVRNNPQLNEEEVRYLETMLAIARRSRLEEQPKVEKKVAAMVGPEPVGSKITAPARPNESAQAEDDRRKKHLNDQQAQADAKSAVQADAKSAAQALSMTSIPPEWRDKLVSQNDKYFLRDDPKATLFRANNHELATKLNSPEVAKLLAATADERGWDNIKVRGTETFRREVFVEATARGIQVTGYKGTEVDFQEASLRARQFEDRNRVIADKQAVRNLSPEAIAARNTAQSAEAVAIASTEQYLNSSTADPTTRKIIEASMRQRLSERAPGATAVINMKSPEGELVAFGAAKYKFDSELDESYYATLKRGQTERTIWGKGLEEAIDKAKAREGDYVRFERGDSEVVDVTSRVRDQETKQVNVQQVTGQRQGWKADVLVRTQDPQKSPTPDRTRSQTRTRTRIRGKDDDLNQEMQR